MAGLQVRMRARTGELTGPTTGLAPGNIQANLIVLPANVANHFELLCTRNQVPCPLLGKSTHPGKHYSFTPHNLFRNTSAETIDIRHDIPRYNIYEDGCLQESKGDIEDEWAEDSVAFLIGCSFSFEAALAKAGLPPRQIQLRCNVPMYQTNIKLLPAGIFVDAKMVVSMRPYRTEDIEQVRKITRPFVQTHGEPIAWGWQAVKELGIRDIDNPDFGDTVTFEPDEVPVFWGCGVTPQAAVMAAGGKISGKVMAHKPGHMLVLDITEEELFQSQLN